MLTPNEPTPRGDETGDWARGYAAAVADFDAYLNQRRSNAALVAERTPEFADWAADRRRQLDVQIDELRAGLFVGAAGVRAQIEGED